ncbi:MAG: hypothetical protein MUE33_12490 [Cytophagaceae bacterium]|jgi:hypothetical protein|nr:hypothetical protein [Cytophagaceae bacterium]
MPVRLKHISVVLFFIGIGVSMSLAQDITKIDWKKPIKISGGFSITNTFYESQGMPARRDPWYWLISGNANIQLFNVIAMPVSAQWSQQNRSYTQPFNHYGVSPTYKALTLHIGYRSLQYSTYSLGGNQWLGAGVEIKPSTSPWSFSALYGRFQKGVDVFAGNSVVAGTPAYERWAYASKIAYQKNGRSVAIQWLRGKDDASSVDDSTAAKAGIKPGMNFLWALQTTQKISGSILFDLEYAMSAYTDDHRTPSSDVTRHRYLNSFGSFFTTNTSTRVNRAIQTSVTWSKKVYQLKFSYRRVDPGYASMGSIFLNNDIEDISGGLTIKWCKQKVTTNTTLGLQRNNLDNKLTQEAVRNAFAASIQWTVSKRIQLQTQYSNFLANTRFNNQNVTANQLNLQQNSDSLRYNQVTQNASLTGTIQWGDSLIRQSVQGTGSWQSAVDSKGMGSEFYSAMSSYTLGFVPSRWNISASFLTTYNTVNGVLNRLVGPGCTVSKGISKSFRLTFNMAYATNFIEDKNIGYTLNNRVAAQYKKGKHHSISADFSWLQRKQVKIVQTTSAEYRFNIVYGYIF